MKKILLIDNYDSFTYNLVHLIKSLGREVDVFRNDAISLEEVEAYGKILLSPGPGIPSEAGLLQEIVRRFAPTKSILPKSLFIIISKWCLFTERTQATNTIGKNDIIIPCNLPCKVSVLILSFSL